jgi:hypothetical protein
VHLTFPGGAHAPRGEPRLIDLGRLVIGGSALAVGILYLLDAMGVLEAGEVLGAWWPVVIVAVGLAQLAERARPATGPLVVTAAGTLLLLSTTGVLPGSTWSYVWPAALVAAGALALTRWRGAGPVRGAVDGRDLVSATGVLGGAEVASDSPAFRGASLTAVLGGVTLDLRRARLDPGGAAVTATALMGGIDILVPRGWAVRVRGMPILGGVEDKTLHAGADEGPVLRIDALAALGGVEVSHGKKGEAPGAPG